MRSSQFVGSHQLVAFVCNFRLRLPEIHKRVSKMSRGNIQNSHGVVMDILKPSQFLFFLYFDSRMRAVLMTGNNRNLKVQVWRTTQRTNNAHMKQVHMSSCQRWTLCNTVSMEATANEGDIMWAGNNVPTWNAVPSCARENSLGCQTRSQNHNQSEPSETTAEYSTLTIAAERCWL